MSKFIDRLQKISAIKESLVCIGLDPDPQKMPCSDIFGFCKTIIDSTQNLTAAYKPNMGFFEAFGIDGLRSLEKVILCHENPCLVHPYDLVPVCKDSIIGSNPNVNASEMIEG